MHVKVSAGRKSCRPWCTTVTRTFRAQGEFMWFSWSSLNFHLEDTQTWFRIASCNAKPSLDHGCEEDKCNTRVTVEINIHVVGGHDHTSCILDCAVLCDIYCISVTSTTRRRRRRWVSSSVLKDIEDVEWSEGKWSEMFVLSSIYCNVAVRSFCVVRFLIIICFSLLFSNYSTYAF